MANDDVFVIEFAKLWKTGKEREREREKGKEQTDRELNTGSCSVTNLTSIVHN